MVRITEMEKIIIIVIRIITVIEGAEKSSFSPFLLGPSIAKSQVKHVN